MVFSKNVFTYHSEFQQNTFKNNYSKNDLTGVLFVNSKFNYKRLNLKIVLSVF